MAANQHSQKFIDSFDIRGDSTKNKSFAKNSKDELLQKI
jgi:hypothetical protein